MAKGGKGGLGNMHFKSSVTRSPRRATPGDEGEARTLKMELKLLADVGLLGFPNAGKSTFIRAVSAATPKVADYPFTTLYPNLEMCIRDRIGGADRVFIVFHHDHCITQVAQAYQRTQQALVVALVQACLLYTSRCV